VIAQESKPVTDKPPVPPAITAAKKVFISNAGSDDASGKIFGIGPDHVYSEFYRQVQALNRFEIVSSPSDADLVLEINMTHSADVPGPGAFRTGNGVVRARIIDPKTHIVLWAFYQHPEIADRIHTYRKNTDKAITQIVSDLKAISAPGS
jgi:hypothetical protein